MLGCGARVHRSLRWGALGLAGLVLATAVSGDADARTRHQSWIREHGTDMPEIAEWSWHA